MIRTKCDGEPHSMTPPNLTQWLRLNFIITVSVYHMNLRDIKIFALSSASWVMLELNISLN